MNMEQELLTLLKKALGNPIFSAFGGAAFGQVVSHYFTRNRDTSKDIKEKYQNLYSPLAFKIVLYVKCEQAYYIMKLDDSCMEQPYPHPRKVFQNILDDLKANIKYATPEIMSLYEKLNRASVLSMRISDLGEATKAYYEVLDRQSFNLTQSWDWEKDRKIRIEFCESFINEYLNISKKLNALSTSIKEEITQTLFTCKIDLLCHDCYCNELTPKFLRYAQNRKATLKTTLRLNRKIDRTRQKINRLREKIKKKSKKMHPSCFTPGFQCLEQVIRESSETMHIKSELYRSLQPDKEYMYDYVRGMNSDGIAG